ncbi:MAG: tetratricopeptide repeat protein, partial [Treponema sp.]|nr:tetratricopeptide repeat protein [Treponema sp.]
MRKEIFHAGICLGLLSAGLLGGCSSAPRRPAAVFTVKNLASTQLALVHKETDRGNYEQALDLLEEVRRLAVSTDDPELLIREGITRGNILYALGHTAEAEAVWNRALAEAELVGAAELAGIVRIYKARSLLLRDGATAARVKAQVNAELAALGSDKPALALSWTVIGLAEKELGRWSEAEGALQKALAIHEQDTYLEQAAYDWFLIASVRSMAGQYAGALEALGKAIGFDRRAENSYGLATDWRAQGDVYQKMGKSPEATEAYRRAAAIFRSIFLEAEALQVESRL